LTYIIFALIIFTLKIQNLSLAVIQFSIFFCILVDIGECKFIFVYVLCYVFSGLKDLTFLSIFPEQLHWWEVCPTPSAMEDISLVYGLVSWGMEER